MVTLKDGNERAPKQPLGAAYRPPNSLIHRLSDGENWGTLAARYKVSAEQLMDLNFGTHNPYEVNWCLREYVRCDTTTPDRYNWRFSTSSRYRGGPRAGVIFVQPLWYALVDAARIVGRRWWTQTLRSASLAPTMVPMSMHVRLEAPNLSYRPAAPELSAYTLRLQGATDDLAAAWVAAMARALSLTWGSIHDIVPVPAAAVPKSHAGPAPMTFALNDWRPLADAKIWPGAGHFVTEVLGPLGAMSDAPARRALWQYGTWWAESMKRLQGTVTASGVIGTGVYHPVQRAFLGSVWAGTGFLRGVY